MRARASSTSTETADLSSPVSFRHRQGDGNLSFVGIKFDDARIASVVIKTGDVAPGPKDDRHDDIVMMDDFIYGEPQLLPSIR